MASTAFAAAPTTRAACPQRWAGEASCSYARVPRRAALRPSMHAGSIARRAAMAPAAAAQRGGLSYKDAGVDIDAGNELVRRIQKLNPNIGGFSGMVPFGDSFLVAGTDGVGTKLKLAFDVGKHDTVGIDLVAMSVNDIITSGAKPMFFLDYFATGKLDVDTAEQVLMGWESDCVWGWRFQGRRGNVGSLTGEAGMRVNWCLEKKAFSEFSAQACTAHRSAPLSKPPPGFISTGVLGLDWAPKDGHS